MRRRTRGSAARDAILDAGNKEVKVRLRGVTAVLTALCLGVGLLASASQVEPIRIGVACELTGPRAMNGIDRMRGARMAVDAINEAGGVLGRPLELVIEDTRGEVPTAIAVAELFAEVHKVSAVIETSFSFLNVAVHEVYWEAGIPFLIGGTSPALTKYGNPYLFRTRTNDILTTAVMARFAVETLQGKRIAVAFIMNDFGYGARDALVKVLKDLFGIVPVVLVGIPPGLTDATGPIMELAAAEPDVVIQFAHGWESGHMYKSRYELGRAHIPWIVSVGGIDPAAIRMAGAEAVINAFSVADFAFDEPAVRAFRQLFMGVWGEDFMTHESMRGWDLVHLLALAIERAGSDEPRAIRDALVGIHMRGIRYDIQIREDGEGIFENKILEIVGGVTLFRQLVRFPIDIEL